MRDYPRTRFTNEAQFRRGELLFTMKNYVESEKAYSAVLHGPPRAAPFQDRALYMMGWSVYKQGRLEDALKSFFAVLDLKVAGRAGDGPLDTIPGLSRPDRELVEDSLCIVRVASISLANLQGAASIPPCHGHARRARSYEFRVYEQLAELYVKQERPKGRRRHLRHLREAQSAERAGAGDAGPQ